MPTKQQAADTASRVRQLRDQRFVIDALEAELTLSAPENEARLKERLATERKALEDLEARWGHQPKSKLIRPHNTSSDA
jgi:hypothetical protein